MAIAIGSRLNSEAPPIATQPLGMIGSQMTFSAGEIGFITPRFSSTKEEHKIGGDSMFEVFVYERSDRNRMVRDR